MTGVGANNDLYSSRRVQGRLDDDHSGKGSPGRWGVSGSTRSGRTRDEGRGRNPPEDTGLRDPHPSPSVGPGLRDADRGPKGRRTRDTTLRPNVHSPQEALVGAKYP